jgi:hypothetical protein
MGMAWTGHYLISGGLDGKLQTWSRKNDYSPVTRFPRGSGSVIQLHSNNDKLVLLSRLGDPNCYYLVEIWDLEMLENMTGD